MKDFAFETKINVCDWTVLSFLNYEKIHSVDVYDSTVLSFLNYEKIHSVNVGSKIRPGDVSSFDYGYNYFILMDLNIFVGASESHVSGCFWLLAQNFGRWQGLTNFMLFCHSMTAG